MHLRKLQERSNLYLVLFVSAFFTAYKVVNILNNQNLQVVATLKTKQSRVLLGNVESLKVNDLLRKIVTSMNNQLLCKHCKISIT